MSDVDESKVRVAGLSTSVLRREIALEQTNETAFWSWFDRGELGWRLSAIVAGINDAIELLALAASCAWGCQGGDHATEHLLRRFTNHCLAGIRCATSGLVDEAFGPVRAAAELANLIHLFAVDPASSTAWSEEDSDTVRRSFAPGKVRARLRRLRQQLIVDDTVYWRLCEVGVHPSTRTLAETHNLSGTAFVGGGPPEVTLPGIALVLNELGYLLAPMLRVTQAVVTIPTDELARAEEIYARLAAALSPSRISI